MKKLAFAVLSAAMSLGFMFGGFATLPARAGGQVMLGDLIKGESSNAVYYYYGNRYAFPNEDVYFSWYEDFSQVKTVSDAFLASVPLAANMPYRPGTRLIKVESDPKVYFLKDPKTLVWIYTEEDAMMLYGADWAKEVRDVSVALFTDYVVDEESGAYLYEGDREVSQGRYMSPEAIYGGGTFDLFGGTFPEIGDPAAMYPVPSGAEVTASFNGYYATSDQGQESLAVFYINDSLNNGWTLASDETIFFEVGGRIMRFEKRQDGSDIARFVLLAEEAGIVTVLFSETLVPDNMYFPDPVVPILSYTKPPSTHISMIGFLSAEELKQWYLGQALSRGWLYMGEKQHAGTEFTTELLFKSQNSHDWFTLSISDFDASSFGEVDASMNPDGLSVSFFNLHLIDVRD